MTRPLRPHPVCGQRALLPRHLTPLALSFAAPGTAGPEDVERRLRCALEAHPAGDHHALVLDLHGRDTGAVWTSWADEHQPQALDVRADCTAVSPPPHGQEPCCEFAAHPGAHSFDVDDPLEGPEGCRS